MIRQMSGKSIKKVLSKIAVIAIILSGFCPSISAAESTPASKIPQELISRQPKNHDPSLAISVEAVLYKLKRHLPLTLVDVRGRENFERLHIPGSINLPLHAVKTKTYLISSPVVMINEGFRYEILANEGRRLAERGFKVSILDGGLPAWKRQGGQLVGDPFALNEMKTVSPQAFFHAKNYENTKVIDISPHPSAASGRLMPYARHIPILDGGDGSKPELRKLLKKSKPFQTIVVFTEFGKQYDKAEKMLNRLGIDSFHLQGGLIEYQKFLDGLVLSWKPRDSRMKTIGNCKPCGENIKDVSAGSEIVRQE